MPPTDRTDPFGRLLAITLLGARVGFASGFGLTAAQLAMAFAPLGWEAPAFAVAGGTSTTIFWWIGSRMIRARRRGSAKIKMTHIAPTTRFERAILHRYCYHSDLLNLAATIFDWSERMYFWNSIVNNAYLQRLTPDSQIVLKIRATSENPDYTQILDLEKYSGFRCAEVNPVPSDEAEPLSQLND